MLNVLWDFNIIAGFPSRCVVLGFVLLSLWFGFLLWWCEPIYHEVGGAVSLGVHWSLFVPVLFSVLCRWVRVDLSLYFCDFSVLGCFYASLSVVRFDPKLDAD